MAVSYAPAEVVRWIVGRNTPESAETAFLLAIQAGRLDVLDDLYARYGGIASDCILYTRTAAELRDPAVLARLREWGCEWDHTVVHTALMNGRLAVAQWAGEHGCPMTSEPLSAVDDAYVRQRMLRRVSTNKK